MPTRNLHLTKKTLLTLLLISTPILSAPVPAPVPQSHSHTNTATNAGGNGNIGIPDGPEWSTDDYFTNTYTEDLNSPGTPEVLDEDSETAYTETGSNNHIGIPDGPYFDWSDSFENTYEESNSFSEPEPEEPKELEGQDLEEIPVIPSNIPTAPPKPVPEGPVPVPEVPQNDEEIPTPSLPLPPPPTSNPPSVDLYTPVPISDYVNGPPAETEIYTGTQVGILTQVPPTATRTPIPVPEDEDESIVEGPNENLDHDDEGEAEIDACPVPDDESEVEGESEAGAENQPLPSADAQVNTQPEFVHELQDLIDKEKEALEEAFEQAAQLVPEQGQEKSCPCAS
ncbi:putative cell wall protein [Aspergillus undulatus]|uniref:putative cell wall protein n=1 Tax=Aspergillus undulatus TaxID=1810928 RepID=UPI003CCD59B3